MKSDTIKPYTTGGREPTTPDQQQPVRKQLRFDTDEVYLSYLGKSTPTEKDRPKVNIPQ
jgi:hypothetical protein